jgi:hypothetical protein
MKRLFNWTFILGLIFTLGGGYLACYTGPGMTDNIETVEAPSTQTDNPVFALPWYLIKVLISIGGPILVIVVGACIALVGLILLLIGFIRAIWPKKQAAPPPLPEITAP